MRPGVTPGRGGAGVPGPFCKCMFWPFLPGSAFRRSAHLCVASVPVSADALLRLSRGASVRGCAGALTSLLRDPLRCSGLHRPQTEAEVLEQSAQTLRTHLGALLSALSRSVRACPAVVRATFRQLFRRVRERFPSAQHEVRPLPVGPGGGKKAGAGGGALASRARRGR